jgi:hypothetical protein
MRRMEDDDAEEEEEEKEEHVIEHQELHLMADRAPSECRGMSN